MKRIYLVLIATIAITFVSCSDQEIDTVKPDAGQVAPIIDLPEGATQGRILVKFKPEAGILFGCCYHPLCRGCFDSFRNFGYGCRSAANRHF